MLFDIRIDKVEILWINHGNFSKNLIWRCTLYTEQTIRISWIPVLYNCSKNWEWRATGILGSRQSVTEMSTAAHAVDWRPYVNYEDVWMKIALWRVCVNMDVSKEWKLLLHINTHTESTSHSYIVPVHTDTYRIVDCDISCVHYQILIAEHAANFTFNSLFIFHIIIFLFFCQFLHFIRLLAPGGSLFTKKVLILGRYGQLSSNLNYFSSALYYAVDLFSPQR